MRPASIDEVVGQDHVTGPGTPLRRLLEGGGRMRTSSVILWGPPGTGKTTLAMLAAAGTGRRFVELSAVNSGVKELRAVLDEARQQRDLHDRQTVLFADEAHRWNKAVLDVLLPAVENGWVTLIAATTENPSFSLIPALLSRSLLLTLRPVPDDAIAAALRNATRDPRGLGGNVDVTDDAVDALVRLAGGDVRRGYTVLEAAAALAEDTAADGDRPVVTVDTVSAIGTGAVVRYDRQGDQHYDIVSAFIKSLRGSDVDAALHYLARMITAGEDPRFIARRLVVHASEDVGLADSGALQTAVAAAHTVALVGMPEARLALAQATIHIALAPKSNAVYAALGAAMADVERGLHGDVPPHLKDAHYAGAERVGHGVGYVYPHDDPRGVVEQQYAPTPVLGRSYYRPTRHGMEAKWAEIFDRNRRVVRGDADECDPA